MTSASSDVASKLTYDLVQPHEIEAAFKLEEEGFPADEAATLDKLQSVPPPDPRFWGDSDELKHNKTGIASPTHRSCF